MALLKLLVLLVVISQCYGEDINIAIIGKVGSGKSTLLNNLMGQKVAEVGHYETGTYDIQKYTIEKFGYTFNIYDTPGLFDINIDMDTVFKKYNKMDKINMFLICFDVSQPRIYDMDIEVFNRLKTEYSESIFNHSVLILTKSNLIRGKDVNEKMNIITNQYKKLNTSLFGITAYDENQLVSYGGNYWIDTIWQYMGNKSRNNGYLLEANHIRTRVCKPAKDMMSYIDYNGVYPKYTESIIKFKYETCIREAEMKQKQTAANGAALSLIGFILLSVFTGGGAGLLGSLAAAGGGSIAAGGLGIIGGTTIISGAGYLAGASIANFDNYDCYYDAVSKLIPQIDEYHYDEFINSNGVRLFSGYFLNNIPNGEGTIYQYGKPLWKGEFKNGIPTIC